MGWKLMEIALYVVLPLGWGLAVEWVFERLRRRRRGRGGGGDDWVI